MSEEKECKLRYFYGEPYYVTNKTKVYELDPCIGGTHTRTYEVVKYHPDIFGMMHLQPVGLRAVVANRVVVTQPPTLVGELAEVSLYMRVPVGVIFSFSDNPEVKYKMRGLKHIRPRDIRISFGRIDRQPLTTEEIELVKKSKHIYIKNGL